MVQEFHVVRCFSCLSFQVHQVKKVNRWTCKLCGQKQSLLKEFGRGSGADCRRHVQKLNAMRGAIMEEQQHNTWSLCEQEDADEEEGEEEPRDKQVGDTQVSRWSKYLHSAEEVDPEEEEPRESGMMDRQHFHGNRSSSRKRKRPEDEGQDHTCTPAQTNCPKLRPSAADRCTGFRDDRTTSPPSLSCGSRLQVQVPSVCGWRRTEGEATDQACDDTSRPRPPLPVCSMFESGEDFDFDDF